MAKIYGALEVAQLEWFTQSPDTRPSAASNTYRVIYASDVKQIQISDGTSWLPSNITIYTAGTLPAAGATNQYQIAFITDTLQVKVSNGSVWTTIGARLDTFTSGTIPAAASYTNQMIWVSDLQQVQVSNGTAWIPVGATSGVKNYFSQNNANPNFETNSVTPWSACTLTFSSGVPSGAPTLTATQMSIATTAATPLAGTYSMQLTKAAANAQYQGFISGALTIDREDTAKVLYGSFSYEVISGTVDFSGASTQTYEIWIYNTVSGAWTQPAGYRGMNQSSGQGKVTFSFQTDGSATNNSYKIAVITQQTGTGSIVVEFDSFQIGPSAIILGAAVSDWQSYTPTFQGFGTPTSVQFQWRRVGADLEVRGRFNPGTSTAVEARVSFPNGLTSADTSLIPALQIAGMAASNATAANSRTVLIEPSVTYFTFGVTTNGPLTRNNGNVVATSPEVFAFFAKVAIQGWSSNVQMSNDTDTRVVAAAANTLSSTTVPANAALIFNTTTIDTHGAITTGAGYKYTVPVSGNYRISCSFPPIASGSGSIYAAKNGSFTFTAQNFICPSSTSIGSGGSIVLPLVAGDTIQFAFNIAATANSVNANFAIERLSGPSAIAASETVALRYTNTAGSSYGTSDTLMPFATKDYDTHNAWVTNTFTAPISGKYLVNCTFTSASTGIVLDSKIYKNASLFCTLGYGYSTGSTRAIGTATVNLNAGDTVSIYASSNVAGSLSTVAGLNHFSITRVGN